MANSPEVLKICPVSDHPGEADLLSPIEKTETQRSFHRPSHHLQRNALRPIRPCQVAMDRLDVELHRIRRDPKITPPRVHCRSPLSQRATFWRSVLPFALDRANSSRMISRTVCTTVCCSMWAHRASLIIV